MSTKPRTDTKRFIAPLQSKGSLGKSTFASFLLEWYRYAGIPFAAVDADVAHQSLKNRYPDNTEPFPALKSKESFGVMLDRLPESPVVLFDAPAQMTSDFLEYAAHYRLLEAFERKGWKTTLLMFMSPDEDARESASGLVKYFGEFADYLMIDNPKLFQSEEFKRTGLFKWLSHRGAPIITMPEMLKVSKINWEALETKEGKHLSISQVIEHPGCSTYAHFELSGCRDLMFAQLENHARFLVPDLGLIKQKVTRAADIKSFNKPSRFADPLFTKE
ncbi:MAG TPA: hypothetical protein VN956_11095 [Pyrinomonadaceae bacterium]|nr:hypothetical protein [Pyrinomonadaceae bacterium]